jgi:hypothetical protein
VIVLTRGARACILFPETAEGGMLRRRLDAGHIDQSSFGSMDVALLASQAALSLEYRLFTSTGSLESVRELAAYLNRIASPELTELDGKSQLADIQATAFWLRALSADTESPYSTVTAVLEAAKQVLARLENASEASGRDEMEVLRRDCLRLSLAAQRNMELPYRSDEELMSA